MNSGITYDQLRLQDVQELLRCNEETFLRKLQAKTNHMLQSRKESQRGQPLRPGDKVRYKYSVTNWRNFPEKDSEKDVKNYITSVLKERRTKLIKEHMETRKAEQVIKEQEEGSPEKRRKRESESTLPSWLA
ncbi:hypothetical protein PNOK_0627900 [Pyrrhoderma noxium]|uniref:Uncharacterized protein n=1 Tax=Pyrrhoderma noxium TaxID=2282107 RepID=A0A286UDX6_9AGAM|nr:hypothetical protein PNOK_0627900 [Pyrrhoderma noxium]